MKATAQLKAEHQAVKTAMAILDEITSRIEGGEEFETDHLEQLLEFIRVFADRCHHGKEEGLLLPALEASGAPIAEIAIGEVLDEHDRMRGYIGKINGALSRYRQGEQSAAGILVENIRAYLRQLAAHIDKEDAILYPFADRYLSERQQEKLFAEFKRLEDERIGPGVHDQFHAMLHKLSECYLPEKAGVK